MNPPQSPVEDIPEFILRNVEKNPRTITRLVMGRFAMTRPAAMQHVNRLIAAGQLIASGSTRDRKYSLALLTDATSRFPITPQLREDSVWRDSTRPHLDSVPQNVLEVCQYGLTEMVSNVVDHSEGQAMVVAVRRSAAHVRIMVHDDGIGIFNKISRDLNLGEPRHAILELAKGKLTTDPTRHTGEGIFFTSRMFEGFSILSDGLFFSHTQPTDDWLIEHDKQASGTMIVLEISPMATTTTKQVFDRYSPEDADYAFTRTHVPVALARYGDERLVSRSQAKRLLARFDRFSEVILDFKGISSIGQAFADEIFRVFRGQKPDVSLFPVNTSEEVKQMIDRVSSQGQPTDKDVSG